ncbi:MAG: amidohydrolase family protein [Gemmatimonadota bacterium]
MTIVDAHHHLWERGRFRYAWLEGAGPLNRDYRLADFEAAIAGTGVSASVFVQADADEAFGIQEARWVLSMADDAGPIQAVVAWAPVERPDLEDYLTRLGSHPKLRGVRRLIQGEPDPGFCARPEFVAGVRKLGEAGLSFDACVHHPQLPALVRLAAAAPDTAIVLDHIGKPAIATGQVQPWRTHLRELAAMDHVACKLSGLVTEARRDAWEVDQLRPYADAVVEAFGFERLMFGSDWPVCTLASEYGRWLEAVQELVRGASEGERRALFCESAQRFYRV